MGRGEAALLAVYDASDADKDAARFVELECSSHKVVVEGCDVSVGNLKLRTEGRDRDRVSRGSGPTPLNLL